MFKLFLVVLVSITPPGEHYPLMCTRAVVSAHHATQAMELADGEYKNVYEDADREINTYQAVIIQEQTNLVREGVLIGTIMYGDDCFPDE